MKWKNYTKKLSQKIGMRKCEVFSSLYFNVISLILMLRVKVNERNFQSRLQNLASETIEPFLCKYCILKMFMSLFRNENQNKNETTTKMPRRHM